MTAVNDSPAPSPGIRVISITAGSSVRVVSITAGGSIAGDLYYRTSITVLHAPTVTPDPQAASR